MFSCTTCGKTFPSRGKRDSHGRICGKTWDVEFKNDHVTIHAQHDGQIICQCDHISCRRIYTTFDGFKNHIQNAKNANWTDKIPVSNYNYVFAVIISYILLHRLHMMYVIK